MFKSLQTTRKLISTTGYEGFKKQLKPWDVLVLQYEGPNEEGMHTVELKDESVFNNLVYGLDGYDIYGFYAMPLVDFKILKSETRSRFIKTATQAELDDDVYDIKTTISRPVEGLVLTMIERGGDLNWALYLKYGFRKEHLGHERIERSDPRHPANKRAGTGDYWAVDHRRSTDELRRITSTHAIIVG